MGVCAVITDLTPYRRYVDQFDLTDAQKLELVNAVSMIVEKVYDRQLGINQLLVMDKEAHKSIDKEVPPSSIDDAKFIAN